MIWDEKIDNFIKLIKTKRLLTIASQPIQNFKPDQIKEIIKSQYTFKPAINKISKQIVEQKIENTEGEVRDLYNKETIRGKKFKAMVEEHDRKIKDNLTFTPKINKKSARSSSYYPNDQEYEQIKEDLQFKQNIRQKVQEEVKKKREEEELAECTFHPKTNTLNMKIFSEPPRPLNFEKEIGRMRYAYYERMEKKHRAEKVPVGEKYEYLRSLPVDPPKCATNYIIRTEEPFLYLDVSTGNGKTGRIGLKADDDPYLKAREFAVAFQLDEEMEAGLAALLCEQLELYWEEQGIDEALLEAEYDE